MPSCPFLWNKFAKDGHVALAEAEVQQADLCKEGVCVGGLLIRQLLSVGDYIF